MIDITTLRWPESDVRGKQAIIPEAKGAIPHFLPYIANRRGVIQAGGNVGIYPIMLAEHFEEVVTVEPDPTNYACLEANLMACDDATWSKVIPVHAALSDIAGLMQRRYESEPDNCGAHQFTTDDAGDVTTTIIDRLRLRKPVDCIWLDVEGAELPALRGGLGVIMAYSPVLILEEKGHGAAFGWSESDLHTFLSGLGYAERARYANDRLYTR